MTCPPLSRRQWLHGATATAAALAAPRSRAQNAGPFPEAALHDSDEWDRAAFREAFRPALSPTRVVHKFWPATVRLFDLEPHSVIARCRDESIECLTFLFLDAGTHFGYVPQSEARRTEAENRDAFRALHARVSATVRAGVEKLAGSSGTAATLGREPMLSQSVTLFRSGNLTARLHTIDEQLVKLVFFREESTARHWFDPAELERRDNERKTTYARATTRHPNGDVLLDDIPLLPQGDRAYCGVSALAMAMQSLGLWIDTEDYAASAGIRYGSTQGSHIRETYEAAAAEGGFRLARATAYDHEKTIASLDAGLPVIVWRRWAQERDFLHTAFLKKLARDPEARLPEPDAADRAGWPARQAYNHASVITGYNTERQEVLFTESWSESMRHRRMRPEEMAGTAYYAFSLRL